MRGRGPSGGRRPVRRAVGGVVLLLAAAIAAGCDGPGGAGDGDAGWDRATVAEHTVTIGETAGPEEQVFGDVTSVAADAAGRIYVADRVGSLLRVYGPDGRFLRQIGREGRGPGEYESPVDLAFGPEGRLHVRDANRVTVLAPAGGEGVADSVVATRSRCPPTRRSGPPGRLTTWSASGPDAWSRGCPTPPSPRSPTGT